MKSGDTLYGFYLREYTVDTVGKKYFTCNETGHKFDIQSLQNMSDFPNGLHRLYYSKQEVLDIKETEKLERQFRNMLLQYGRSKLSLSQLRLIKNIIDEAI